MKATTTSESGTVYTFRRDRHGNLRVEDFDSTRTPWAEARAERRVRRERREMKRAEMFLTA